MVSSQALYSGLYSRSSGVSSLMTEPSERSAPRIVRVVRCGRVLETPAVIALDQFRDLVKILFEIGDEHRPGQDRVGDGLGNFRFAAAGNRAGFVAKRAFGDRAHQPPGAGSRPGFSMRTL